MKSMRWHFVFAMTVGGMGLASGQADVSPEAEATPMFFFDAMSYASEKDSASRIDFYIQVPHEELRFVKEGDKYVAQYDVTLSISNPDQQLLQERTWSVDVRLPEFSATVSRNAYSLTQRAIDISPGSYNVEVHVRDSDSKKSGTIRRAMLVTDFQKDSLSLSDIMLISRLSTEGDKRKIVPNVSGNIGTLGEGFFLFFEIYNETPGDSVELTWRIFNTKREVVGSAAQLEAIPENRIQTFVRVEDLKLPVGTYLITVDAVPKGAVVPELKATTSRNFTVRWSDIPASITDLKKAVEQMRYIAPPAEFDRMREAEPEEEMRKQFVEFWSKRDPDPSTEKNELMEEYYHRVEYANKNFGHYMDGWKTDRGMIYIRFGSPDNVERHPFDMNTKPYEIWYYYELERQFVFVDETGFGDYRLRYPTTDLWGRVR